MKQMIATFLLLFLTWAPAAQAQYGEAVMRAVLTTLTDGSSGWKAIAYPTDNFGIGTMYDGKKDSDFMCATSSCLGVNSDAELQRLYEAGSGGSIDLDSTQTNAFVVAGLIPKVLRLAKLGANFNREGVVVTKFNITSATRRMLKRGDVVKRIRGLDSDDPVAIAWANKKLRVVVGDIVVDGLRAEITVDKSTNAGLVAALQRLSAPVAPAPEASPSSASSSVEGTSSASPTPAQGSSPENLATTGGPKEPGLELRISMRVDGKFTLTSTKPVVVAVLFRKQPAAGTLGPETTWRDWESEPDGTVWEQ